MGVCVCVCVYVCVCVCVCVCVYVCVYVYLKRHHAQLLLRFTSTWRYPFRPGAVFTPSATHFPQLCTHTQQHLAPQLRWQPWKIRSVVQALSLHVVTTAAMYAMHAMC